MKYFRDKENSVFAFDDDFLDIPSGFFEITETEKDAILAASRPAAKPVAVVSMRQARLALLESGKLADVQSAIDALPEGAQKEAVKIEWEYAGTLERDSATTQTLAAAVGLDAVQLQALFDLAVTK